MSASAVTETLLLSTIDATVDTTTTTTTTILLSPQTSGLPTTDLPPPLQSAVPTCAHHCLAHAVLEQYDCPLDDIQCLCTSYSSHGFTLEELAVLCERNRCRPGTPSPNTSVFDVCAAQLGAVSATRSIAATSTASQTSPSATATTASAASSSETSSSTSSHRTFTTSPSIVTMSSTSHTTSSPATTSAAAITSGTSHPSALTNAQAAGIAVAVAGTGILVICAILFLAWRRKGRPVAQSSANAADDSYDFVDREPGPDESSETIDSQAHIGRPYSSVLDSSLHLIPTEKADFPITIPESSRPAIPPQMPSRFLPAEPGPTPPRTTEEKPPMYAADSYARRMDESNRQISRTSPSHTSSIRPGMPLQPESNPRVPPLARPGRPQFDSIDRTRDPQFPRPPAPVAQPVRPPRTSSRGHPQRPNIGIATYSSRNLPPLPPAPTSTIAVAHRDFSGRQQPSENTSCSSDASSFETASVFDLTPPSEEPTSHLSPPQASPLPASPIRDIRYPKVPRPSNQAVPRYVPPPTPPKPRREPMPSQQHAAPQAATEKKAETRQMQGPTTPLSRPAFPPPFHAPQSRREPPRRPLTLNSTPASRGLPRHPDAQRPAPPPLSLSPQNDHPSSARAQPPTPPADARSQPSSRYPAPHRPPMRRPPPLDSESRRLPTLRDARRPVAAQQRLDAVGAKEMSIAVALTTPTATALPASRAWASPPPEYARAQSPRCGW